MFKRIINDEMDQVVFRESDGAWIPVQPENRDYQEFLKKVDENAAVVSEVIDKRLGPKKPLPDLPKEAKK